MPRVVALVALVVVGSAARAYACDVEGPSTPGVASATVVVPAGFVGFRFGPTFGLLVGAELTGARIGPRASYGGYGRVFAIDSPRGSTWDVEAGFAGGPSFESEACAGRRVAFARVGLALRGPLDAPDRTFAARVSTMGAAFFAGFLGLSIPLGRGFSPELSVGVGLGVPIEVH